MPRREQRPNELIDLTPVQRVERLRLYGFNVDVVPNMPEPRDPSARAVYVDNRPVAWFISRSVAREAAELFKRFWPACQGKNVTTREK